jgi:hypothetical protein
MSNASSPITAGSMDYLRPEISAETVELMALVANKLSVQIPIGGRLARGLFFAQARGAVEVESSREYHTVKMARGRHPRRRPSNGMGD